MMPKEYRVEEVTENIGMSFTLKGKPEGKRFKSAKSIYEADEYSLVWVNPKKEIELHRTSARIVICSTHTKIPEDLLATKCFILVENPKLAYIRIVEKFFVTRPAYGVHPTAYVEREADVHINTYIGPFTYVGRSSVGEGTVIFGHCHIYDGVRIGKNVIIHAGTVIGSDGYGYSRNEDGELEKFPHIGGVIIEDNVEIGANTCVDKGTLGDTIIGQSAKIDNLVHIAHNVVVGRDAAVIANAMVGGSTNIGDRSWIAPSAALINGISIGAGATVGLGAVVTKSIPDGETWAGVPAQPLKDFVMIQKKLKDLR